MKSHGQFCSVARAQDVLGGRWTLLVLREVLSGSRRFNEIRRGIPRISRSVLSDRLQGLVHAGLLVRTETEGGACYAPTEAGADAMEAIAALAVWGQKWVPRRTEAEDLDLDPIAMDMARRVDEAVLPHAPGVLRLSFERHPPRFILLKRGECAACDSNPGFLEILEIGGSLAALAAWWRGDKSLAAAQRDGLLLSGPGEARRAFGGWFRRYIFADVGPATPADGTSA